MKKIQKPEVLVFIPHLRADGLCVREYVWPTFTLPCVLTNVQVRSACTGQTNFLTQQREDGGSGSICFKPIRGKEVWRC